ncbi:hypothetical protein SBY92_003920 [Candida maltosa Xu316]
MSENIEITAKDIENTIDKDRNERLHLQPIDRLKVSFTVGAVIGSMMGAYDGIKTSSLRYLTENAHRLPKTVGGWYFYHKKKNYMMITGGAKQALKRGLKYGGAIGIFCGLEQLLDTARGNTIDFINTTTAAFLLSSVYATFNKLSYMQTKKMIFKGTMLGLAFGLAQDFLIYRRDGRVWYIEKYIKDEKNSLEIS